MVKQKSSVLGGYAKCIITLIGLIWLILGIFVASSPKIAPKILQWNYIFAWILLFGFPCTFLLWLGLHGLYRKSKTAFTEKVKKERYQNIFTQEGQFSKSENNVMAFEDSKTKDKKKEDFSETKFCHHCHAIISEDEYERYGGLCYGCYIDFKREHRRSGLLGADRASTW